MTASPTANPTATGAGLTVTGNQALLRALGFIGVMTVGMRGVRLPGIMITGYGDIRIPVPAMKSRGG